MASLTGRRVVRRGQFILVDQGDVYELNDVPLIIGRNQDQCEICIPQKTISRCHAQLTQENGKCYLEDLGSVSGTFINEERIEAHIKYPVNVTDTIRIADYSLQIEFKMGLPVENSQVEKTNIDQAKAEAVPLENPEVPPKILESPLIEQLPDISADENEDVEFDGKGNVGLAGWSSETAIMTKVEEVIQKAPALEKDGRSENLEAYLNRLLSEASFSTKQTTTVKMIVELVIEGDNRAKKTMVDFLNKWTEDLSAPVVQGIQDECINTESDDYTRAIGVQPVIETPPVVNSPRQVIRREPRQVTQTDEIIMPINPYQSISEPSVTTSDPEKPPNYGNCPLLLPILLEGERIEIPISKTPFIIGKSSQHSDFPLNARGISRSHCLITFHDGNYFITDLGSTNGVCVNKKRLKPHKECKIKSTDKIILGSNQFLFEIPS